MAGSCHEGRWFLQERDKWALVFVGWLCALRVSTAYVAEFSEKANKGDSLLAG